MRHQAWLHAVPDGSKKSRLTILKERDENSNLLTLPLIDGAEYLVNLLNEAGLFQTNGMGTVPIAWQEIESWLRCTDLRLTTWEILTIRSLSEAYVSELNQASDKNREAPYSHYEPPNRDVVQSKLKNALKSFKRTPST